LVSIVLLLIIGILSVINSNYFNIKDVEINGNELLTEDYILDLCKLRSGINIFAVDKEELVEILFALPQIKGVTVDRKLPDGLVIMINERRPVAIIGDDSSYRIIDKKGWILRISENLAEWDLPLITGVRINYFSDKISIDNLQLKAGLSYLNKLPKSILEEISEMNLSDKEGINLFLLNGESVRLGENFDIEKKARVFISIYNRLKSKQREFEYIDLRYDSNTLVKIKQ